MVAGVTNWVDLVELNEIASDPDRDNMMLAENFDALPSIRDGLKRAICNGKDFDTHTFIRDSLKRAMC